jgi:hypothetical protein
MWDIVVVNFVQHGHNFISCFIREAFDAEDRQNFIISPGVIVQEGDFAEVGRVEIVEERVSAGCGVEMET